VYRTTDGGTTWTPTSVAQLATGLLDIALTPDALHGWATTWMPDDGVIATTDGGATWTAQNVGSGQSLYGLACTDATHVWAVGEEGGILATTTGGARPQPSTDEGAGRRHRDARPPLRSALRGQRQGRRHGARRHPRADRKGQARAHVHARPATRERGAFGVAQGDDGEGQLPLVRVCRATPPAMPRRASAARS
jgi:hypothetical protein